MRPIIDEVAYDLPGAVDAEGRGWPAPRASMVVQEDKAKRWWTRTQRIRTVAENLFEVALLDEVVASVYHRVAQTHIQAKPAPMLLQKADSK